MGYPCKKCGEEFHKGTKYSKLCPACHAKALATPAKKPHHRFLVCPICNDLIKNDEARVWVKSISCSTNAETKNPAKMKKLETYHLSCWKDKIAPEIEKLVSKNKLSSLIKQVKYTEGFE